MAKTIKTVKASIGEYTDRDGKVKHRYRTIGSVIATKAGEMLVIDVTPWNWDGRAFLNDPEQDEQPRFQRNNPMDDDIQF